MRWSHTFTILGRPTSYKNGRQGFIRKPAPGKPSTKCPHCRRPVVADVAKSPQAKHWFKTALKQLESQWTYRPIPKTELVDLEIVAYFPTQQFADCTAIIDGVQDALQETKVVENDSCFVPRDTIRRVDAKNPRVVARISLTRERDRDQLPPLLAVDKPPQVV